MWNLKRYVGLIVLLAGVGVIALGVVFVTRGAASKADIRAALADEQVTTKVGEVEVPVLDQRTAMAQADIIKSHTLERYGPWQTIPSKLDSGEPNPTRQTFLNGLTLRNSLYIARIGLDIAEMVIVLGAALLLTGSAMAVTGVVLVGVSRHVTKEVKGGEAAMVPAGGAR